MLKNILAAIGLFYIAKKGYGHYQEYSGLKQKQEKAAQTDSQSQQ